MKFSVIRMLVVALLTTFLSTVGIAKDASASAASRTATSTLSPCMDTDVYVPVDITGSFVDTLAMPEFRRGVDQRLQSLIPDNLCIGSDLRVGILGHSASGVSKSMDHLRQRIFSVSRNHMSADKVKEMSTSQIKKIITDVTEGKIKRHENTAVAQSFDNIAELIALRGRRAIVIAITDGDDTEFGKVAAPFKPGQLKGTRVYMIGAGATLEAGTSAQRSLRQQWEAYMVTAGAESFFWVSKP